MSRKGYIVSPFYDAVFFIYSPLLAFFLGYGVAHTPSARQPWLVGGQFERMSDTFLGVIIYAHLFLVFFRSHANVKIFKTYPFRFTVVPLLLFIGCWKSIHIMVITSVVATWWDVYHSGLQTFGLGRIYDARAGNDAQVGRRLDYFFNLILYAGPILGGAALMDHLNDFREFDNPRIHWTFFSGIPAWVAPRSAYLTRVVFLIAVPFLVYYVWSYWRFYREGYKISHQKVTLYVVTALVSIASWGFNSFGQAFLIMNFFHAWQYFAIVWWSENKNLTEILGVSKFRLGKGLTFVIVFGSALIYGWWSNIFNGQKSALFAATLVVSIMHFWYDGFIWSVRKKQIPD